MVDKKLNLVSYLLRLLDYKEQYLGAIIIRIPFSDNKISRAVFCECFENVVNDCSPTPRQTDPLNILEPWQQVIVIDKRAKNQKFLCATSKTQN